MSGFALPPDPEEQKQKQQKKTDEDTKEKVSPEHESRHRMIFALVVYASILGLLVFSVPAIGGMFSDSVSGIAEPEDASPAISSLWQVLDMLVVVRRDARGERYIWRGLGSHWYTFLAPALLVVMFQLAFKDKRVAARAHYYFTVMLAIVMILGCALLLFELLGQRPGGV